ncbi:hypothetical protein [Dysgonomonas termitidis]|uniref:Uncharacterized protein n=1 Tax=Dysgonomonas termitidis TaxID=1516126 RepID=A0ABV9KR98_9BACT
MKKTKKITDEFWDFIEKYLPGYYKRDDILRHADLKLFIDGHESTVTGLTVEEAAVELSVLSLKITNEAIDAYTKGLGVECERCNSGKGNYCTHCGKLLPPQNQKLEELRTKYIKEIKEIIDQYGKFSTASIMADSSPIVKDDSYTTQLAEQFGADKVTLITYSKETDQEMGEEDVPYEKLSMKVLAKIHSLAIEWKEDNE